MKRCVFLIGLILTIAGFAFAANKPTTCKWAGRYIGIVNVTSLPSVKYAPGNYVAKRVIGAFEVNDDYTFKYGEMTYEGVSLGYVNGVMTKSGTFTMTNNTGGKLTGKFGAKGVVTFSYVSYLDYPKKKAVERGTFTGYRETVLP